MGHVLRLAHFGIREAGRRSERKSARYIAEQMKQMSLQVVEERFTFQSFILVDTVLEAGSEKAPIVRLGFNPYSTTAPIAGELAFVPASDDSSIVKADLDSKLVVIPGTAAFNKVSFSRIPKAIACLSSRDFQRVKASGATSGRIRIRGSRSTAQSSNIVGVLGHLPSAQEIILSAHYDSFQGPGANDNASGVGILLELARYFHSVKLPPKVSMRFVAFGAEEFGFLGSKAYLQKHQIELQKCRLLFNIDQVGGDGAIYTDTGGGVRGVPDTVASQLSREFGDKAITDRSLRWMLPMSTERPLWDSRNAPEWLRTSVSTVATGLGRDVFASQDSGSDHRVFVQAGIVATDISVEGGAQTHAPTDVPDAVHTDSMELAARLVTGVIQYMLCSNTN